MKIFVCATLSVLVSAVSVHGLCSKLKEETWDNLIQLLDLSSIAAIVCPFHIKDDGCPKQQSEYILDKADPMSLICGGFLIGSSDACIIDCPTTAFAVAEGRSFTLSAITIRGAEDTAVVVKSDATFTAVQSLFEENKSPGNGGAIRGEVDSALILHESFFGFNTARGSGGAIYSNGMIESTKTEYLANHATIFGGAMAVVQNTALTSSSVTLDSNIMKENRAKMGGPAVFSNPAVTNIDLEENIACYNYDEKTREFCDGTFDGDSCTSFKSSCISSTPSPSILASHEPSMSPSVHPANKPSEGPSTSPSQDPTINPTTGFPSLSPSRNPSIKPTGIPSNLPSLSPTIMQSNGPTSVPSFRSPSPSFASTMSRPFVDPSATPVTPAEKLTEMQPVVPTQATSLNSPTIIPSVNTYVSPTSTPTIHPPSIFSVSGSEILPIAPSQQKTVETVETSDIRSLVPIPALSGAPAVSESLSTFPNEALAEATGELSFGSSTDISSYVDFENPSMNPTSKEQIRGPSLERTDDDYTKVPSLPPTRVFTDILSTYPTSHLTHTSSIAPSVVQSSVPSFEKSLQPSQVPSSVPHATSSLQEPAHVQSLVDEAACSANPRCMALGLAGSCCPTIDGVQLYCC